MRGRAHNFSSISLLTQDSGFLTRCEVVCSQTSVWLTGWISCWSAPYVYEGSRHVQRGRGGEGHCLVSLDSPGTWICVPDLGHTPVREEKVERR